MARTFRNLWPRLISWRNLLRAYDKCRRRKRSRPEAAAFDFAWEEHLLSLQADPIDHFIKEELRVPGYVRYADDLLLFGDDKGQLWDWRDALAERLATMRMRLHSDKTQLRATSIRSLAHFAPIGPASASSTSPIS